MPGKSTNESATGQERPIRRTRRDGEQVDALDLGGVVYICELHDRSAEALNNLRLQALAEVGAITNSLAEARATLIAGAKAEATVLAVDAIINTTLDLCAVLS